MFFHDRKLIVKEDIGGRKSGAKSWHRKENRLLRCLSRDERSNLISISADFQIFILIIEIRSICVIEYIYSIVIYLTRKKYR